MAGLTPLIGAAFAKVGAVAGVTGAGAATAGAGLVSTVAGGILQFAQGRYQSAMMLRMAAQEEENAARIRTAGNKEAQMQDMAAVEEIADTIAQQGASGFSLNSGSFVRRQGRLRELATRDRTRIVEDASAQAQSAQNRAASYRAEASAAKPSLFLSLLNMGLGINKSLISGINLNSSSAITGINNTARGI